MKQRTSDFKNQIKELGRELSNKIGIYGNYKEILATEDDKLMLTQDDVMLIAKEIDGGIEFEILDNNLFNVNVVQNGKMLSTMMKELDFESDLNLKVGTILNYKLGLKVNNDYEYLNYGDFIIYKKELNEDTKHWVYTCYDAMLKTMATVDDRTIVENTLIVNAIINIANKFELEVNTPDELLDEFPNLEQSILTDTFKDIEMTYRDVLDQICQAVGCQLYVDNNEIKFKSINQLIVSKNLFGVEDFSKTYSYQGNELTAIYENNILTLNGTGTGYVEFIQPINETILKGTYTLSLKYISGTRSNDSSSLSVRNAINNAHIFNVVFRQEDNSKTYTFDDSTSVIFGILGSDTTTFNNYKIKIQLEKGSEATEYEPYHEPEYKQVSVDTIDKTYLKDTNVTFKEKYGPINSLVLSRSEDNDNVNVKDDASIEENGLHEFKIKDNLILNNQDRDDFIDNIFNQIKGLEFYINDYQSVGICYLDWLDTYNVEIDSNSYQCLMLNDEIKIKSGLSETIYTEAPEETVSDYTTMTKSDKEVSFIVDKQKGEISSKVSKDGVISSINQSPEQISINASKVNLTGYITATDLAGSGTTTINGSNITTGTIDASRVNVTNLNASNITTGTLTGQTINGGTITGTNITTDTGTIGGCTVDSAGIYSGTGSTTAGVGLYGQRWAFWAGSTPSDTGNAPFHVDHAGRLTASSADITGSISAGNSTYYIRMGADWTKNPELSGLNITGGQGVNLFDNDITRARKILATNTDLLLCSTAGTVKIGNTNTLSSGQPIEVYTSKTYINQYLEVTTSANFWVYKSDGTTRLRLYEYINEASSRKVKENVKQLDNKFVDELYKEVKELQLYSYDYKKEYRETDRKNKYGFMLDDVENTNIEKILDIEKNDETSLYSAKGLAKLDLIIIKELIKKVDKQQEEIDLLKQEIELLKRSDK